MESPTDAELYEQLLGYLAAEGEIVEDGGSIVITEFDHRPLRQPLRLRLTTATFGEHLRRKASDAASLHPDLAPVEAAWRLFLVHLDEAVQTARSGETELVVVPGGVITRRADGTRTPQSSEVEEHLVLNDWYERLIGHYADRGEVTIDVHREVLGIHALDGRCFDPALRVHATAEDMRRLIEAADDPAAVWSSIVDQFDRLAAVVDPGAVELVLTEAGVVERQRF